MLEAATEVCGARWVLLLSLLGVTSVCICVPGSEEACCTCCGVLAASCLLTSECVDPAARAAPAAYALPAAASC